MEILRTDGSGENRNDERLLRVKKKLFLFDLFGNEVIKLHDHKGLLSVYWKLKPSDKQKKLLDIIWYFENEYEIEHFCLPNNFFEPC